MGDIPWQLVLISAAVIFVAGFVKGAVGFAMPMIMVSVLGSILPANTALAILILPTLVSNIAQALQHGWRAAWESVQGFRVYLAIMLGCILISAQFVRVLPPDILLLMIGVPVVFFSIIQLVGFDFTLSHRARRLVEPWVAAVSGIIGGMSGVWGPPLVLFLTALGTEKREQMRVQGVVFGLGAVMLTVGHLGSGILNRATLPLSALALLPALAGIWMGRKLHDRLPQQGFRRLTLAILVLVGLNLVRRGLAG